MGGKGHAMEGKDGNGSQTHTIAVTLEDALVRNRYPSGVSWRDPESSFESVELRELRITAL